jgi:molecular chaperone GrpE
MRKDRDREDEGPEMVEGEERIPGAVDLSDEGAEAVEDPDLSGEVAELREEVGRLNDRHLRLAAEFDNYRKRVERDRQTLAARLQIDLVASLLEVIDDLERVAETGEGTSASAVVEGVRLVEKKFMAILAAAGLEAIEAEGSPFDPAVMEAVATVPTDDPARDHVVADMFQRGYRLGEVLVRPARVRVLSYEGPAGGGE